MCGVANELTKRPNEVLTSVRHYATQPLPLRAAHERLPGDHELDAEAAPAAPAAEGSAVIRM